MKLHPRRHASWRIVAIGLLAGGSMVALAAFPTSGEPSHAEGVTGASKAAGMRAYIDPDTGELAVPAAGERTERSGGGAAATQPLEHIVEVPSAGTAGGVIMNTKDRFTADVIATTDGAGRVTLECTTGATQPGRPSCISGK